MWLKHYQKKWSSSKYDVIIKAKATPTRIVDINNEIVRPENGAVRDRLVEKIIQEVTGMWWKVNMYVDGSATLPIRYLHKVFAYNR